MVTYATPGAYFELADRAPAGVTPIRTDVAAFVGLAERGPVDTPVKVESWEQFQAAFGSFVPYGFLGYAVKAFFENRGRTCYVTRVAAPEVTVASVPDPGGGAPERGSTQVTGAAAAFVPGAAVTVRQGGAVAVLAVAGVDAAGTRVHWLTPLPERLDPAVPLQLSTGAGAAGVLLRDPAGRPALDVQASSAGTWGNHLAVGAGRSHPAATSAAGRAQPPDGASLYVDSVVGFGPGALVRIAWQQPGGPGVQHRFVAAADPARGLLTWDVPLDGDIAAGRPASLETLEFTLTVTERGRVLERASGLSLHPDHPRFAGGDLDDLTLVRLALPPGWGGDPSSADDLAGRLPEPAPARMLEGGRDGLAGLRAADFTGAAGSPGPRRGLQALEPVDEVAVVAVPDIHIRPAPPVEHAPLPLEPDPCCPQEPEPAAVPLAPEGVVEQPPVFAPEEIAQVQQACVDHCEALRDRVAVLDAPLGLDAGEVTSWRRRFETSWAALYYPWLAVLDPLQRGVAPVRLVPPSGHVAGVYARGDLTVGVHRAPANLGLEWAQDADVAVDAATQAGLNPTGVNCVRVAAGRGLQVYGARTLSSDPALRYVNVRRLLAMIAASMLASMQWAVFEPHDEQLRALLRLGATSFLRALWQAGALAGRRPEHAFFVRCDETNNPPEVVDAGQVRCDLGVAPSLPAEFVVVRIGRADNEWILHD